MMLEQKLMSAANYRNIDYVTRKIIEIGGIEKYISETSRATVRNYKRILDDYIENNYDDVQAKQKYKALVINKINSKVNEKFLIKSFNNIIKEIESNTKIINSFTEDDFYFLTNMILVDLKSSIKKRLSSEQIEFNYNNNVLNVKIIQDNKAVYEFVILRNCELFEKLINTILINNNCLKNSFKISFPQIVKIQLKRFNHRKVELDTKIIKDYIKRVYVQGVIDAND